MQSQKVFLGTVGEYQLYDVWRDGQPFVSICNKFGTEQMLAKDAKTAREWCALQTTKPA